MQKILLSVVTLLLPLAVWAQDATSLSSKYVASEGVKVVGVSPAKFEKTHKLPVISTADGPLDLAPLVADFSSYYLLTSTDSAVNVSLDADIARLLVDGGYQLLRHNDEEGESAAMYVVEKGDSVSHFLLYSNTPAQMVLVALGATMPLAELEDLVLGPQKGDIVEKDIVVERANALSPVGDETASTSRHELSERDNSNYTDIYAYIRAHVPDAMRGPISINSGVEHPLYVVDGIQVSSLDGINPIDVYSVEAVRDASAAIYGFRGVAGVILITTKAAHSAHEAEIQRRAEEKAARKAAKEARKAAKKQKR